MDGFRRLTTEMSDRENNKGNLMAKQSEQPAVPGSSPATGSAISALRRLAEPYAVEWQGNRRDTCYAIGDKMLELNQKQAAAAWRSLARSLMRLGDKDIPKFMDIIADINAATMVGGVCHSNRPSAGLGAAGAQLQAQARDLGIRQTLSPNA